MLVNTMQDFVGGGITNNVELDQAGKSLFGPKYAGTFTSDQVPYDDPRWKYCIANVSEAGEPGTHWVAIARHRGGYMHYDSFGRPAEELIDPPEKLDDTELDAEQDEKEENCGARCLAWLMMFENYGPAIAKKI
jgi:hypothetical protein